MTKTDNKEYLPRLIAWEITKSCNLNCVHCRASAKFGPYTGEFSTDECFKLLDNIAGFSKPIIILTGGEPMMREDIFEVAKYGTDLGLRMVMAPCGLLINEENAKKMVDAGIKRLSFSLDGATKETHDNFRQVSGAFEGVIKGIVCAKAAGLDFQINTTITKFNLHELPKILELAIKLGAVAYHPFLLVPTGRGKNLADQEISPEDYEKTLEWVYEKSLTTPIQFKPTCAPHYYRIFRQKESKRGGKSEQTRSHGLDGMTKGCMGGQSFAFISHIGKVQICGFLEEVCGDIREADYNFEYIWKNSKVFKEMRDVDSYHGRCGYCEYRNLCGGCRARAYAVTGDYLDEEPYCTYEPVLKIK